VSGDYNANTGVVVVVVVVVVVGSTRVAVNENRQRVCRRLFQAVYQYAKQKRNIESNKQSDQHCTLHT